MEAWRACQAEAGRARFRCHWARMIRKRGRANPMASKLPNCGAARLTPTKKTSVGPLGRLAGAEPDSKTDRTARLPGSLCCRSPVMSASRGRVSRVSHRSTWEKRSSGAGLSSSRWARGSVCQHGSGIRAMAASCCNGRPLNSHRTRPVLSKRPREDVRSPSRPTALDSTKPARGRRTAWRWTLKLEVRRASLHNALVPISGPCLCAEAASLALACNKQGRRRISLSARGGDRQRITASNPAGQPSDWTSLQGGRCAAVSLPRSGPPTLHLQFSARRPQVVDLA